MVYDPPKNRAENIIPSERLLSEPCNQDDLRTKLRKMSYQMNMEYYEMQKIQLENNQLRKKIAFLENKVTELAFKAENNNEGNLDTDDEEAQSVTFKSPFLDFLKNDEPKNKQ